MSLRREYRNTNRDTVTIIVAGFAGIIDLIVTVLTWGHWSTDYRADVLFSDWAHRGDR